MTKKTKKPVTILTAPSTDASRVLRPEATGMGSSNSSQPLLQGLFRIAAIETAIINNNHKPDHECFQIPPFRAIAAAYFIHPR